MSYEPTQQPDSGNTPPYGTPPQGPYPPPQGPYPPPPEAYGPPPQGPYPPQEPYGVPPQGPYSPPPQDPYGGRPPTYQQQQGYGSAPAAAAPLPLGEAIRQLPGQYIKVLTKPSAATFAAEMGKAAWNIVWVQLIGLAIIGAVLGYLAYLINPGRFTSQLILLSTTLGEIVIVPLVFFIFVGIIYQTAKAFGGQGTFLAQGYSYLLVSVPLGIISLVLSLVPVVGIVATYALSIYALVLNIFAIMAVQRLSGGKATAVVFITIGVLFVVFIVIGIIIGVIIATSIRPA